MNITVGIADIKVTDDPRVISIFKPSRKLKNMDIIIDANPHMVKAVHADLTKGLKDRNNRNENRKRGLF